MIYPLRYYQQDGKDAISALFGDGILSVLFCAPTGSGKTVTFANMARDAVNNGVKVMILVDRKELLDQAKEKLSEYGLRPTIMTGGKTGNINAMAFICTVQTLARRETLPPVGLIIIDEAHKGIFDKIVSHEYYKNTYKIGATATPKRTGNMNQLTDFYQSMVETVTISELISKEFLVPAITYGAKVDTSNIKMKGKDYDTDSLFNAFDKVSLYSGVVDKYERFAKGTKAVVFNINVKHSLKVLHSFRQAGYVCEHLDGKTPKAKRESILKAFKIGAIQILCNCDVLTTGWDEWTLETVIVNRATQSLPLWLQMGGRGSRITPSQYKGKSGYLQKSHFNLIDMGGNVQRLGFWEEDRKFSLSHKLKDALGVAPVKECPEDKADVNGRTGCGAIVRASATVCPHCNHKFEIKKKELVEGEFIQLPNAKKLPVDLANKAWGVMGFEELERVRIALGYK